MMRGQTAICEATTRTGTSCHNIPMKNGRCRMHGRKSTGPKDRKKLRVLLQKYKVRWRTYRKLYCYQFHVRLGEGEYLHVFYKNFREKEGFLHTLRLETRPEYYKRLSEIWNWQRYETVHRNKTSTIMRP